MHLELPLIKVEDVVICEVDEFLVSPSPCRMKLEKVRNLFSRTRHFEIITCILQSGQRIDNQKLTFQHKYNIT